MLVFGKIGEGVFKVLKVRCESCEKVFDLKSFEGIDICNECCEKFKMEEDESE